VNTGGHTYLKFHACRTTTIFKFGGPDSEIANAGQNIGSSEGLESVKTWSACLCNWCSWTMETTAYFHYHYHSITTTISSPGLVLSTPQKVVARYQNLTSEVVVQHVDDLLHLLSAAYHRQVRPRPQHFSASEPRVPPRVEPVPTLAPTHGARGSDGGEGHGVTGRADEVTLRIVARGSWNIIRDGVLEMAELT
jgi:hypothetical protein